MGAGLDKSTLKSEIESAYKKAKDSGLKKNADPDAIIATLSKELAAAIKKYMESAKVVTDHIIPPGQEQQLRQEQQRVQTVTWHMRLMLLCFQT